ncbi:DNA-binding protein [halophilic archaeon]|nr:DNA-binding protein [halophilic archaeon]
MVDGAELRPTVELERQATIDCNHPDAVERETRDGRFDGQTLASEERILAEEAELERYAERAREREALDERPEMGTRRAVGVQARTATTAFEARTRARAVGRTIPPAEDPRERLSQSEVATVNQCAQRLTEVVQNGPSRAAFSRRIAERVERGASVTTAAIGVREAVEREPGVIQDVASIEPWQYEASVEAEVAPLWSPKSSTQQQVGMLDDGTGTMKFTVWKKSRQDAVLREGDRVWIQAAKVNRYRGRATLAADSRTSIVVLERGDGDAPVHGDSEASYEGEVSQNLARYGRAVRGRRRTT